MHSYKEIDMVYWIEAPKELTDLAQSLIEQYHQHLMSVTIGFILRSEPAAAKGRVVWGQASKVSDRWRPLLKDELDFVIWIAEDAWKDWSPQKKRALLDHELCHCKYEPLTGRAWLAGHDIEEFNEIIERHGLWRDDLTRTAKVMRQQPLISFQATVDGKPAGKVVTLTPEEMDRVPA